MNITTVHVIHTTSAVLSTRKLSSEIHLAVVVSHIKTGLTTEAILRIVGTDIHQTDKQLKDRNAKLQLCEIHT